MSVYGFSGRLRNTFQKDKLYFPVSSYWKNKFTYQIKRMLFENDIIDTTNYDLKNIHKLVDDKYINYNQYDGTSPLGRLFYEPDEEFINNYHEFLKWLNINVFRFDFYFQATPTIRFNCADAQLTGEDKRLPYPRYHCDVEYGHPPQETNLWWSFTENKQS